MPIKWPTRKKMDKFLKRYYLPTLDQEDIENMNRPITSTEIESVIKNLPKNQAQGNKKIL